MPRASQRMRTGLWGSALLSGLFGAYGCKELVSGSRSEGVDALIIAAILFAIFSFLLKWIGPRSGSDAAPPRRR
jgi:hypothetical protein